MKFIRISVIDNTGTIVYHAEKIISWHEYERMKPGACAEILKLTVDELNAQLIYKKEEA